EESDSLNELRDHRGLVGEKFRLANNSYLKLRVGGQGVLELIECARGTQFHKHRLECVSSVIRGLKHGGIGPKFGFRSAAPARKNSDNFPVVLSNTQLPAEFQPGKRPGRPCADDDFILSRL